VSVVNVLHFGELDRRTEIVWDDHTVEGYGMLGRSLAHVGKGRIKVGVDSANNLFEDGVGQPLFFT